MYVTYMVSYVTGYMVTYVSCQTIKTLLVDRADLVRHGDPLADICES
jgi:hypothetical protein